MSSYSNNSADQSPVSKVSFSPISDELLCVRIRPVNTGIPEETPKMATLHPVPPKPGGNGSSSRSYKTGSHKTASSSSKKKRKDKTDDGKSEHKHDSSPCLRHAAENISRKASDIPSEKINLCGSCSKSMLSYIFLVQDFLDSLAKEISGSESSHCLQCVRQEVRDSIATSGTKGVDSPSRERASSESKQKDSADNRPSGTRTRKKAYHYESKDSEGFQKDLVNPPPRGHLSEQQQSFNYTGTPPSIVVRDVDNQNLSSSTGDNHPSSESQYASEQKSLDNRQNFTEQWAAANNQNFNRQWTEDDNQNNNQQWSARDNQNINQNETDNRHLTRNEPTAGSEEKRDHASHSSDHIRSDGQSPERQIFRAPMERAQPNYDAPAPYGQTDHHQYEPSNNPADSPSLFREDIDGIISTLSNMDREIYDNARKRAGWEGLSEPVEKFVLPPNDVIATEAFVTSCRNNAEAVGCLVVGTSLLLCRTTRTLCVLVSDGVSTAFRGALSSVFQVVQNVRSLDSLGTTKLALLEQPEIGVSFEKLHIWRLVQFTKCVYLNPDTVVIQNCDELFGREELSAVPDIGWPDCFNSGVFVYSPSVNTFWQLIEFAEKQGSYDGGDQGLLNSYFNFWSSDISKKLSFIYNLMANVSYTYTPAFRQFGRDVKVVQFHGSFKPWHVKFFTNSGQISPSSPVHPTYVQFVHIWLSIFRISVLRLMSKEIQSYAASQETICAVEILRFFPLPTESEAEFFLTPPSVRVRLAEKRLTRSVSMPISEARRRKSAEFFRYVDPDEDVPEVSAAGVVEETGVADETKSPVSTTDDHQAVEQLETSASAADEVFKDAETDEEKVTAAKQKVRDENAIPGAEVGDYQGMKAWEQGRMDYQGTASSDNVLKRLEFLISKP